MLLTKEEILKHLSIDNYENTKSLFEKANECRSRVVGDIVYLRALIEFSNYCQRNCAYCGLRRDNSKLRRYRMTVEEILANVKEAEVFGYRTVVLQSGEDPYFTGAKVTELLKKIKKETKVVITLSIGERAKGHYEAWREAGADRYLLRHETANQELYTKLHPEGTFENRIKCLENLKELGYEVGAGFMVGLPGQKFEDLVEDVRLLSKLKVSMAGIGPFLPHPETPLAGETGGDLKKTLKMVALTRLSLPELNLPATTALGSLDKTGREQALQCGANVIMPNATPSKYRPLYELYPDKICLEDSPEHCRHCIEGKILRLGRMTDLKVAQGTSKVGKEDWGVV